MNINDLRELTQKVCLYRVANNLTYKEFCELADISHLDLVALQVGNYGEVSEEVVKKAKAVVNA